MASFRDTAEREWTVSLDAPTCLLIRSDCDPDFMLEKEGREGTYDRLCGDPVLLCRVIYLICKRQLAGHKTTEEQFYLDVLGNGDTIDEASQALLDAMLLFTPKRSREMAKAIATKTNRMAELAQAKVMARMNDPALEADMLAAMDAMLDQTLEKLKTRLSSATNSPGTAG